MGDHKNVNLPPGFRFYPTDEELVVHFLHRKVALLPCHPDVIPDLDLYPYDPWDLHGKALGEDNKWYFYSRKTQNRVTSNGYWKPLGVEEAVIGRCGGKKVGTKKYLVFHAGDASSSIKTNWIMHEFHLSDSASASSTSSSSNSTRTSKRRTTNKLDCSKWVLCRVYERDDDDDGAELSCLDEVFLSLDDLDEISLPNRV
uniref:NAC domain-containing protein n=1 Tax=Boehmeria nivea TaxID=83906 RepID=A0A060A5Q2_BOENI|nr:NAC domain-containing protein [Boehmeria nivea]